MIPHVIATALQHHGAIGGRWVIIGGPLGGRQGASWRATRGPLEGTRGPLGALGATGGRQGGGRGPLEGARGH